MEDISQKKYDAAAKEAFLAKFWEEKQLYKWDSSQSREKTFVVDTPPPTVSGALHLGHVFSYTQTDVITRFQRMLGKNIFYPMGWDDNGLPTERRVQNFFNIRCDPRLPYDPSWKASLDTPAADGPAKIISRKNFIEACAVLTKKDEEVFEQLWRQIGLSLDWSETYATIDDHCRSASQKSFLDLISKKLLYNSFSPTVWDVDFRSAVAQAEIEDREIPGAFYDIKFTIEGGGDLTIATTRPELLPACIAVVAHPDDARYKNLFGKFAVTPLFNARVPIMKAEYADPEKGTGILMVCTFGDQNDIEFWKHSKLAIRQVIGLDGRMSEVEFGKADFGSLKPEEANRAYANLLGLTVKQAQKKIAELLKTSGDLIGEPKPVTHAVRFYEKGDRPLEYISTRQWFIKILDHKKDLLAQGRKIKWHPQHMLARYENWVLGLNQDWCISRQRFFGVPFPVWYPIDKQGNTKYDAPIFAALDQLPIDPLSDAPPGFSEAQRDVKGGFAGDPDVMDTWATSSLSPQIASYWGVSEERHKKLFPMDLRPQAHEIIRTWAFYTIVKSWFHEKEIPWHNAVISGWILDPDRKKMSKSKGNVITPYDLLNKFSSDAVRYWASRARLGADTAVDEGVFKIGQKLVTKLVNAAKFVLQQPAPQNFDLKLVTAELDKGWLEQLKETVSAASENFHAFDYAAALQTSEESFWYFCDHYLELVKKRSYSETDSAERVSAKITLRFSISVFLRLFAPVVPFVTEEIWSWEFAKAGSASIHTARWPSLEEFKNLSEPENSAALKVAVEVLSQIRGAKTEAQVSLRTAVNSLTVTASEAECLSLKAVLSDVIDAGGIADSSKITFTASAEKSSAIQVKTELAAG
jgi:valyl-tRNA synthetase